MNDALLMMAMKNKNNEQIATNNGTFKVKILNTE